MKILVIYFLLFLPAYLTAQTCAAPTGNQTSYGTNNQWVGYVYNNEDFTNYYGFVTAGTAESPNFIENFGGDYTNFSTSTCPVYTETFSVRYKLNKNFAAGAYDIAVGGDDGFRLSVDGGATWIIDSFTQHNVVVKTARVNLNGSTNLVLEYFEHEVINQLSFEINAVCAGTGTETVYGTNNQWIGYVYDNINFTNYKGTIGEGSFSNSSFFEEFGSPLGFRSTNQCVFLTDSFSVRFRLRQSFTDGNYSFEVGGDDGYRLSFDGGVTWPLTNFGKHSYVTSTYTTRLNGVYDMVLEYFDNDGDNIVSYDQKAPLLAAGLQNFTAASVDNNSNILQWGYQHTNDVLRFETERSSNGKDFKKIGEVFVNSINAPGVQVFDYTDLQPASGDNYYRLRILYKNGNTDYSKLALVNEKNRRGLLVFPNPVINRQLKVLAITTAQNVECRLYDLSGKLLNQYKVGNVVTDQILSFKLPANLSSGNYIFSYSNNKGESIKQTITVL
ncbi:MAG: T9SS type A sorting domain-containing protein [Bacteroidota bacterium]